MGFDFPYASFACEQILSEFRQVIPVWRREANPGYYDAAFIYHSFESE
jgi:hypothetical protein